MDRFSAVESKIMSLHDLKKAVAHWRLKSQKIVFTNGCFDILHYGHVSYLAHAASRGNRLIIGLNSDRSVKKLNKGSSRPIQHEVERATLLAALGFVSAVAIFEEDTPYELIKAIEPDVLVKGGDWKPDQIVGGDLVLALGGEVDSIPFLEGHSTTSIEKKIIEAYLATH